MRPRTCTPLLYRATGCRQHAAAAQGNALQAIGQCRAAAVGRAPPFAVPVQPTLLPPALQLVGIKVLVPSKDLAAKHYAEHE